MIQRPRLAPCPGCHRHVRLDERACPFCGAALATAAPPPERTAVPTQRLGRAALFAFGSAIATSAPGCYLAHERGEPVDRSVVDAWRSEDSGNTAPPYGAAPEDSGHPPDARPPETDEPDAGAPVTLYGGPFPIDDAGLAEDANGGNQALYGGPPGEGGGSGT
jgi:hypothetical protein